jgi:hypothetical protein
MDAKCWFSLLGSAYVFDVVSIYVRYCVYNLCTEVLCGAPGLLSSYFHALTNIMIQTNYLGSSWSLFHFYLGNYQKDKSQTSSLKLLKYSLTVSTTFYETILYTDILCGGISSFPHCLNTF